MCDNRSRMVHLACSTLSTALRWKALVLMQRYRQNKRGEGVISNEWLTFWIGSTLLRPVTVAEDELCDRRDRWYCRCGSSFVFSETLYILSSSLLLMKNINCLERRAKFEHIFPRYSYLSTLRNNRITSMTSLPIHHMSCADDVGLGEAAPWYHSDGSTSPSFVVTMIHPCFSCLGALAYRVCMLLSWVICNISSSLRSLIMAAPENVGDGFSLPDLQRSKHIGVQLTYR